MTVFHRRILYLSFSLAFVVAAMLLIVFAKGYRFDLAHGRVYKTGLLVLEMKPKPDSVFLDGKQRSVSGSPIRIAGIVPGNHTVTLRRTGYHDWTRTIGIQPGTSVAISDIQLFRNEEPAYLVRGVNAISLSPNGKTLAIIQNDRVVLYSSDGAQRASFVMPAGTAPRDLVWSPTNAAAVIVTSAGTGFLYEDHRPDLAALPSFPQAENAFWDKRQPQTLYVLGQQTLFSYDILSHASALLENNVMDAMQYEDSLVLVQREGNAAYVRERLRDGNTETWTTLAEQSLTFLPSPSGFVTLLAAEERRLIVLRASGTPRQAQTFSDVLYASWNREGSRLVYGNDYELSVLESTSSGTQTRLLNRTSGGLRNAWWAEPYAALFVERERAVTILDDTASSTGNVLPFLSSDARALSVDPEEQKAFLLLTDGSVVIKPY